MKMKNIRFLYQIAVLFIVMISIPSAYGQSSSSSGSSSSSTQFLGSPNSVMCTIYKSLNLANYQAPAIGIIVLMAGVIIAYESFRILAIRKEEKEGNSEADLNNLMTKIYTTGILSGIIIVILLLIVTLSPMIACGT